VSSAGLGVRPMTALVGISLAVSGAVMATVVLTRGDGARRQQESLVATTAAALRSPDGLDRWVARTARSTAFEKPADGSVRHLYAVRRTATERSVAVDVTLTDGRVLCLVSSLTNSGPAPDPDPAPGVSPVPAAPAASPARAGSPVSTVRHVRHVWHASACRNVPDDHRPVPTPLSPPSRP
jgi:hypothetical protein